MCRRRAEGRCYWIAALVALALGVLGGAVSAAEPEELVTTLYGGTLEKGWRVNIIQPFEKQFNARVRVVTGLSGENFAKLRAQKDNPTIDIFMLNTDLALAGAREGLLQALDSTRIPNLGNLYEFALDKTRQHVAIYTLTMLLAYNTRLVKEKPTSWADMWKPEYKGKVLLPNISQITGPLFISVLANSFGKGWNDTETAFARIKSLRPSILTFTTSHDQTAQLLTQGEAWMQPWYNDRIGTQIKSGAPLGAVLPKEGSIFASGSLAIAKGTKHQALAEKYVNFVLSETAQTANATTIYLAPTNKRARIPAEVAPFVPHGEMMKHLFQVDWGEFNKLRDTWVDRWNREIK